MPAAIIGPIVERIKIKLFEDLATSPKMLFRGRIIPHVAIRSRMRSRSSIGKPGPTRYGLTIQSINASTDGSQAVTEEMWLRDP